VGEEPLEGPWDHTEEQPVLPAEVLLPGDATTLAERIRAANAGYLRVRELNLDDTRPACGSTRGGYDVIPGS
jgi:hypothetical protein